MLDAFLKTLTGQATDEVVWTADLSYWFAAGERAGRGDPRWRTEKGQLEVSRELGVMPYY